MTVRLSARVSAGEIREGMAMKVLELEHFNIRTVLLEETVEFYTQTFGMTVQPPPGLPDITQAAWIYDDAGRAVIHLAHQDLKLPSDRAFGVLPPTKGGGAIHHVALQCSDYDDTLRRLEAANLRVAFNEVPQIGLRQIFLEDPNGVLLELNFHS